MSKRNSGDFVVISAEDWEREKEMNEIVDLGVNH